MSDTTVDVSEMTAAAAEVTTLATTAVPEVVATTLAVRNQANCWGVDEVGAAFAHRYLEPAEAAMSAVQKIAYHLGDIAELLQSSATAYAETEQSNTAESTGIDGSLPPGGLST